MRDGLGLPVPESLVSSATRSKSISLEQVRSQLPIIVTITPDSEEPVRALIAGPAVKAGRVIRVVVQGTEEARRLTTAWSNLRIKKGKSSGGIVSRKVGA